MLPRKSRTSLTLHESPGLVAILVFGRADADIASAFLHDDTEDHTLLNANLYNLSKSIIYADELKECDTKLSRERIGMGEEYLGSFQDSVPNAADIFVGIASLQHLRFVEIEDLFEGFPG